MNDNEFLNTDRYEQLLRPRCDFHASDSLKERIVAEAAKSQNPGFNAFKRYAFRIAAAVCVAAMIGSILLTYISNIPDKSPVIVTDAADAATAPPAIKKNETTEKAIQTGIPTECKSENVKKRPMETVNENTDPVIEEIDDSYDFDIPEFNDENHLTLPMTQEDESIMLPMAMAPEEIIKRQRESTRDYLDYMQQEVESAQHRLIALSENKNK